jgi:uncharacterized membrane protein
MRSVETGRARVVARVLLGAALVVAGIGHLAFARTTFQAQVPDWVPIDKDVVVVVSGVVEIVLGAALVLGRRAPWVGLVTGLFLIAVFPGNISQYVDGHDAFGLTSDTARRNRLVVQPLLVAWAWWSTDALTLLRRRDTGASTVTSGDRVR